MITANTPSPHAGDASRDSCVEVTDRDSLGYGGMGFMHDFVKSNVMHLALAMAEELRKYKITAVAVSPGYLRRSR